MSDHTDISCNASEDRFCKLWQRNVMPEAIDNSPQIYQQLITAYNETQRIYHSQQHIEDCLKLFDHIKTELNNPDAVELAIWYHDAVYQLNANDNEQLSANLFMQHSEGVFEAALRHQVYEHILATLHDGSAMLDHDSKYMVDIDLSSFSMPWEKFIQDSQNVRKEMQHIPDEEFYPKQCAFQQSLLRHGRFYQSDYFYQHYERHALDNIADYMAQLRKKTGINCD